MSKLAKAIEYLIYLFVFLLPLATVWIIDERFLSGFKWQEGTLLLYATEILLWLIIICQALLMFKTGKPLAVNRKKLFFVLIIWAFVLYVGLSVLWSTSRTLSFYFWLKLLEALLLMFVILNARFKTSLILWSFLLSGVAQSVLGLWQFLSQEIVKSKWLGLAGKLPADIFSSVVGTGSHRWLRAYGTLPHPNILGGFLVVCFLAGLYLYFNYPNGWRKIFSAIGLVFITVGLFFSFSRSAWLALVILGASWWLVFILRKRFSDLIRISLYLILILSSLVIIYKPLVFTRLSFNQRLEEKSVEQRFDSWTSAQEVIFKNPVWGVGLGNYTNYLSSFKPGFSGWYYQPAHNIYLLCWAELGLVGLLLFAVVIIFTLYKSADLFAVSSLLSLLVIGLFDHYLWSNYFGLILFWLIVGLALKDFNKTGWGEKLVSKILLELGYFTGRDFYRPDYVSLIATFRCNFKCQTCDIWKKTDFNLEMDLADWLNVSRELKSYLLPETFIEISGGEALIKKDLVLALISDLKKYFKTVTLNTNGSLITPEIIAALEQTSLDALKVSLYSLEADSHNFIRGSEIAFGQALKTVGLVTGSRIKLEVAILITSSNIYQIPQLVDYLYNLGNTAIIIQPLDEIIESLESKNMIKNELVENLWPRVEKSRKLFSWLKNNNFKLKNSPANLIALETYYVSPKDVLKYRCFAGQRNLVVYPNGDISLCFKRQTIGNIKKEKLKKLMKQEAVLERQGIRNCGKYCRVIGCNFSRGLLEIISRK
ncbi:MAG: O-antigen ligase family protein [Candidatus Buchananbacteria bacterium]|nr:O-antigen ligase family protein [Candidatus Buchananbacteria bacterium]